MYLEAPVLLKRGKAYGIIWRLYQVESTIRRDALSKENVPMELTAKFEPEYDPETAELKTKIKVCEFTTVRLILE